MEAFSAATTVAFLPIRGVEEVFASDYGLGMALVLGGLLLGAYGGAGRMPPITLAGILCVVAGVADQFIQVSGQGEGIATRGGTTLIFILVVLLGILFLGMGLRRQGGPLSGVSLAIGIVLLAGSLASLVLAIFQVGGPLGSFD